MRPFIKKLPIIKRYKMHWDISHGESRISKHMKKWHQFIWTCSFETTNGNTICISKLKLDTRGPHMLRARVMGKWVYKTVITLSTTVVFFQTRFFQFFYDWLKHREAKKKNCFNCRVSKWSNIEFSWTIWIQIKWNITENKK